MTSEKEKNSETILVICIGLLIFYLVLKVKVLLTITILLGLIGIFSDYLSSKIVWLWLKISTILGIVNGKILLSIIFFVILTPVALILKLTNKNSLKLKKTKETSIYTTREYTYTGADLEDIW